MKHPDLDTKIMCVMTTILELGEGCRVSLKKSLCLESNEMYRSAQKNYVSNRHLCGGWGWGWVKYQKLILLGTA